MTKIWAAIAAALLCVGTSAAPPTQTAYRCTKDGKTVYTDQPCIDGRQVDTTPTRGMDKATGTVRKGADAMKDEQRERIAEALRPITGLNREGLDAAGRRQKLPADAQRECRQLDATMPKLDEARDASELYRQRLRFKALGC
jgi:hypothetical protein